MLSFQQESSGGVLEVSGSFNLVERNFRVALSAVLTKAIFVHVLVAVGATFMANALEHLEFRSLPGGGLVAFRTSHHFVFSQKPECSIVVLESGSGPETVVSVTGGTLHPTGSLVEVLVAICACLSKAQEGTATTTEFAVHDQLLIVALAAIDPFMSALELISSQPMIELLLIKTDHLELSAMVVVVARRTFLSLHFG